MAALCVGCTPGCWQGQRWVLQVSTRGQAEGGTPAVQGTLPALSHDYLSQGLLGPLYFARQPDGQTRRRGSL